MNRCVTYSGNEEFKGTTKTVVTYLEYLKN